MTSSMTKVPMEVVYKPAWLTWVAATTTCLDALGIDCDPADVAGMTGYAFVMAVHDELCPSGPTMFDWGMLDHGVNVLGRSTLVFGSSDCHTKEHANERTRGHCRTAFDLIRREVEAGRPCVMWGAYVPEFSVAVGVEGDQIHVCSFKELLGQDQPPVRFDELDAPGGPYVMAFPTPTDLSRFEGHADRYAVGHAASLLRRRSAFANYGFGLRAYDRWIRALGAGKLSDFGNAYNAQCWNEAKSFAHRFLERVAKRNAAPDPGEALRYAVGAYEDVLPPMRKLASLFPFPASGESEDEAKRADAIGLLLEAQKAEQKALDALEKAVASWPNPSAG